MTKPKTAALLPTPGDPFLLKHWLRNYERIWKGEVDELRVLVNMQPEQEVRDWIRDRVESVGGIYDERNVGSIGHGAALSILVQDTDADIIVLVEDDTRVRLPGEFTKRIDLIASGATDVVASPRQSMTPGLHAAANRKFGEKGLMSDLGTGHGMWPAFVFVRREDLLKTDRHYGERGWGPNQTVPGLDYTVPEGGEPECADTFGSCAFQLRSMLDVTDDVQFKGPWHWQQQLNLEMTIPWFHIGSLSSSHNLAAPDSILADNRRMTDPMELGEWAHRMAWWERFLRYAGDSLPDHQIIYAQNLQRIRETLGISHEDSRSWNPIIDRLITWREA